MTVTQPIKAVVTEWCPPPAEGLSKRAKKLERYVALAQAEAQAGNLIGAENYYQHAEHFYRLMSSGAGTT